MKKENGKIKVFTKTLQNKPVFKQSSSFKNLFKNDYINNLSISNGNSTEGGFASFRNPTSKSKDHSSNNRSSLYSKKLDGSISNKTDNTMAKKKSSYIKIKSIAEGKPINEKSSNRLRNPLCSSSNAEFKGEQMYRRGLALLNEKNTKIKQIKSERQNDMSKSYTFSPIINKNSAHLSSKNMYRELSLNRSTFDNALDRRLNHSKISQYNKKSRNENDLTADFEKNIKNKNVIAEENKNNDTLNTGKYNGKKLSPEEIKQSASKMYQALELYKAKKEMLREEYYAQTCPFTPQIIDKESPRVENFYYRLQGWIEKKQQNSVRMNNDSSFDKKTGQRYFSPKLVSTKFSKKVPIGVINESDKKFSDMHQKAEQHKIRKVTQIEKHHKQLNDKANLKKIGMKSSQITEEIKQKVFMKIFEYLDMDSTNIIHGSAIDVDSLPDHPIKKIIQPLITELKEQNETLTRDEFIMACEHLLRVQPVADRGAIYDFYFDRENRTKKTIQKYQSEATFTFKPQIKIYNPKSNNNTCIIKKNSESGSSSYRASNIQGDKCKRVNDL